MEIFGCNTGTVLIAIIHQWYQTPFLHSVKYNIKQNFNCPESDLVETK